MNIKATLVHKTDGQRIIYSGLYNELLNSGLLENEFYKNSITSGDCLLIIEGINEDEKNKAIEQMEFELSINKDCEMKKWKPKS